MSEVKWRVCRAVDVDTLCVTDGLFQEYSPDLLVAVDDIGPSDGCNEEVF